MHFSFHLDQNFHLKLFCLSYKFWKRVLIILSFEGKWFSGLHRCNEAMEFLFSGENILAGLKKEEMYSEIIFSGWCNDYQGMQLEMNGKKHRKCGFFNIRWACWILQHQEMRKSEKPLERILFTEGRPTLYWKLIVASTNWCLELVLAFHTFWSISQIGDHWDLFGVCLVFLILFCLNRGIGEKYASMKEPYTFIIGSFWWQIVTLYERCQWKPEQTWSR